MHTCKNTRECKYCICVHVCAIYETHACVVHSTCGLFKLWMICTVHDRGNHWVVASTINSDCSVQNYDSVYSTNY